LIALQARCLSSRIRRTGAEFRVHPELETGDLDRRHQSARTAIRMPLNGSGLRSPRFIRAGTAGDRSKATCRIASALFSIMLLIVPLRPGLPQLVGQASAGEADEFRPVETSQSPAATPSSVPAAVDSICNALAAAATENDLPIDFFTRLIWQESRFDPIAVSRAGAQGVARFMPATARWRGLADPFDPLEAIAQSAKLLRDLRREFGNLGLAAAAYNAGPGRVRDWLAGRRGGEAGGYDSRGMSMGDTLRSILTRLVGYVAVVIAAGCFWLGQRSMS
jgi:hypothetical protein